MVVMYGCGSGGGGSTSGTPTNSSGSSTVSGEVGNFTINLNDGAAVSSSSRHALAIVAGAATSARVVIRKIETVTTQVPIYEVDEEGESTGVIIGTKDVTTTSETYRRVVDAAISGGQVTVTLPVGTYTFDVLTYIAGTPNTILKSGHKEGVEVTSGGSVGLTITDICADPGVSLTSLGKVGSVVMQIPTSIISEQAYNITADAKTPVRKYYELGIALSASGTIPVNTYDLSSNPLTIYGATRLTAPTTTNPADTSLKFTVKYFISDDMLDKTKNESHKNWVRIYPNTVGVSGETLESLFNPFIGVTIPVD